MSRFARRLFTPRVWQQGWSAPSAGPCSAGLTELDPRLAPSGTPVWAVGAAPDHEPRVWVYDDQGNSVASFLAYDPAFTGGVRVSLADLNRDGVMDVVTAPGPGGGPHIRVFDGATGAVGLEFMAYAPNFRGGLQIATGPIGGREVGIVTGPEVGGGPRVRVFSSAGGVRRDFFAFAPDDRSGVRVALGNGVGGPNVFVAGGDQGATIRNFSLISGRKTGEVTLTGVAGDGVRLAVADLDRDNRHELLATFRGATGTEVRVVSGSAGWVGKQIGVPGGDPSGVSVGGWGGKAAIAVAGPAAVRLYSAADGAGTPATTWDATKWGGKGISIAGKNSGSGLVDPSLLASYDFGEGQTILSKSVTSTFNNDAKDTVTITSTVTKVTVAYIDQYKWNYHVVNNNFDSTQVEPYGVGLFMLDVPAYGGVVQMGNTKGWDQRVGELMGVPSYVDWMNPVYGQPGVMSGESGDFWFYTNPTEIVDGVGIAYDGQFAFGTWSESLNVYVPDVRIKTVTWTEKPDADGATFSANPGPGRGIRIYPEKDVPTAESTVRNNVFVDVQLSVPQPGVTVWGRLLDVDDPYASSLPVDDENAEHDNRDLYEPLFMGVSDKDGRIRNTVTIIDYAPGDNFRAVASLNPLVIPATKKFVFARQNDGDKARVEFLTGGFVPCKDDKTVASEDMLTIWRKLHVERDRMAAPIVNPPPGDGPFRGAGVGNTSAVGDDDVDPNGPVELAPISLLQSELRFSYVTVVDDLGSRNSRVTTKFIHNLPDVTEDILNSGKLSRDVYWEKYFWCVQVVSSYELAGAQNDPNVPEADGTVEGISAWLAPGKGVAHVFMEAIRDATANVAGAKDKTTVAARTVLHEVMHIFGVKHDGGELDTQVMIPYPNNLKGEDGDNMLIDPQHAYIRSTLWTLEGGEF